MPANALDIINPRKFFTYRDYLGVPGRTRTFLPKFQEIPKRFKLLNINRLSQNQTCMHIS